MQHIYSNILYDSTYLARAIAIGKSGIIATPTLIPSITKATIVTGSLYKKQYMFGVMVI